MEKQENTQMGAGKERIIEAEYFLVNELLEHIDRGVYREHQLEKEY